MLFNYDLLLEYFGMDGNEDILSHEIKHALNDICVIDNEIEQESFICFSKLSFIKYKTFSLLQDYLKNKGYCHY